jgi:GR25 family glycosyltransferase involved in LPS biosynthesis
MKLLLFLFLFVFGCSCLNFINGDNNIPFIVISIREHRYQGFLERLYDSSNIITNSLVKLNSTDGNTINKELWIKQNLISGQVGLEMRRGQLGCYDSFIKAWKYMIDNQIPYAVIFEDDINLRSSLHKEKMNIWIDEFIESKYHIGYLYSGCSGTMITKHFNKPTQGCFHGNYGFILSLEGAKRLYEKKYPITRPLDWYVGDMIDDNYIMALQIAFKNEELDVITRDHTISDTINIH